MSTKYFIDAAGNYLGAFDGADPPADAVEVAVPPAHGLERWDGAAWVETPALAALRAAEAERVTLEELVEVLKGKGALASADLRAKVQARAVK